MKRSAAIILSLAMVLMLSSGAFAKGWGRGQGPRFAPATQLTEEQRTKLTEARAAFMQETLELRKTMINKAQELRTMMIQKDVDVQAAKTLAYELVDLRGQMAKKFIDHVAKLRQEMGADFPVDMLMQHRGMGGAFMGGGFMGGPGQGMGGPGYGMMGNGPGMGGRGARGAGMARCW